MRLLVFLAVVVTIIAILYYYHPNGNVIDYFSNAKPGTTTGTVVNQPPQASGGTPFAAIAMAPDGSSPLQGSGQAASPAPRPVAPPPPPPAPRQLKSARDKIYKMAADHEVAILGYNEPQLGQVHLTCQAKDKNNIFDFEDALLKFGIRDFDEVKGSFRLQMDPNGRTIVTDSFNIRYIPEY